MDYIDYEKEDLVANFTSLMRDINIDIISGEINFKFVPDIRRLKLGSNLIFSKEYWPIIEKHKHHCVITGSSSLRAFGLIDRDPNDVDLILLDNDKDLIKSLKTGRYPEMDSKDMLGFYTYKSSNSYIVDIFNKPDNLKVIESNGYKFENPLDVMHKKFSIRRRKIQMTRKDHDDIIMCFKKLRGE